MPLRETLSNYWNTIQGNLFPWLEEELGPLSDKLRQLITVLEVSGIEGFVQQWPGLPGRPPSDRAALARAFIAKAVLGIPQTNMLIERLEVDKRLRRLCGWEHAGAIPSEATFSRAFAEFAHSRLPTRVHEALIEKTHEQRLVGHISRDATAIVAREKPERKTAAEPPKRKRGRPRKGEERPKQKRRLERQLDMTLAEMLADLPKACNVGVKRNAKGYKETWIGYKLHLDVADGDIPVSCLLSSASLHDSQAALPLACMTAERVTNCYDLMDSAYDAPEIRDHSLSLGHVPIIDVNPRSRPGLKQEMAEEARRRKLVGHKTAEEVRYNERSSAERVNGRLKDEFGGRTVRVRGPEKVLCHLTFGLIALTVDQLIRLIT